MVFTLKLHHLGTGVELYGNTTLATYQVTLDGTTPSNKDLVSSDTNLLVSFQDLPDMQHTVTLTAYTQSKSTSFVAFDRAVITASGNAFG